jgi:hypothetical protein
MFRLEDLDERACTSVGQFVSIVAHLAGQVVPRQGPPTDRQLGAGLPRRWNQVSNVLYVGRHGDGGKRGSLARR